MSISQALNSAGSGLAATARAIQVASGNVANAMTPGYSVRDLQLSAMSLGAAGGAGVRVLGIGRDADPVMQGLLRTAGAGVARAEVQARFWTTVETAFGTPDQTGGLPAALDRLDAALIAAADRPDLNTRLADVQQAAAGLAKQIGTVQRTVQDQRLQADAAIASDVKTLNDGLHRIHRLNTDIVRAQARGDATLELQDERDMLLQSLSEIVPLRSHMRPEGRVTVFTEGGAVLLDLTPVEVGFTPALGMDPGQTLDGGALSGLTVNGRPVGTGPDGQMSGGSLGAAFALRDRDGPEVQASLDRLAASLIARFQDPATDPSALPGQPGLFTDAGAPMGTDPAPGLAGRLALNAAVDPDAGGALWRLRDGLGAAAPGPVGDNAQIARWMAALDRPVEPAPGVTARSMGQDLSEALTEIGTARFRAEDRRLYALGLQEGLNQQVLERGVDIDAEMRRLVQIETAYAANARVLRVADEMLRRLMEI